MRRLARFAVAALLAAHGVSFAAPALKAGVFDPPRAAPSVALAGSDGRPFDLAQHRGKVVLLAFGFTNCPAVCPTTLATLAQARAALGPAREGVQVVFVTVDPQRDTAPRLKTYLAAFDPSFLGATGSEAALAQLRTGFGATATRVASGGSYAFDHTAAVFLIDRHGKLVGLMPFDKSAQDYVHDLRLLLAAQ